MEISLSLNAGVCAMKKKDRKIKRKIIQQFVQHDVADISKISISVDDGLVMIKGIIPSEYGKALARDVCCLIPGVREIKNHIAVR